MSSQFQEDPYSIRVPTYVVRKVPRVWLLWRDDKHTESLAQRLKSLALLPHSTCEADAGRACAIHNLIAKSQPFTQYLI